MHTFYNYTSTANLKSLFSVVFMHGKAVDSVATD